MKRIKKYIACALSAAMVMTSALAQGAVVSHAEEVDVGIVATAGDAEEADTSLEVETEAEDLEAQRDSKVTESGFEYEETDDGITITGYSGTATEVDIPSEIDGKTVTSIGNGAFSSTFSDRSGLTSINIPDSVTSIGGQAFYGCSGLTEISIPKGVTSIATWAFYGCSGLTSISIPSSVTSIGQNPFVGCSNLSAITVEAGNTVYDSRNGCNAIIETSSNNLISGCKNTVIPDGVTSIDVSAFSGCSGLSSISIPDSVTRIGAYAFEGCSGLTSISIPKNVSAIGTGAFRDCSGLTSITVDEGNEVFDSRDGCNAIIDTYDNSLIRGCKNTLIPDSVTGIDVYAFSGSNGLTSISIPKNVTSIERAAFSGCNDLTNITVEDGNTVYDSRNGCNAIIETSSDTLISGCKNTTIPNTVTSIGGWAFDGCSALTHISIPDSVTSIGDNAFMGCTGLTNIEIPDSVKDIANSAFYGCSGLTSINIPNGVTDLEEPFLGCSSLTSVTIPNSVTSIGWGAFWGCSSLTSIEIPDSVTNIGEVAFFRCSGLTSITIPDSVKSIGYGGFKGCSNLTSIIIPKSVTSIGEDAFKGCSSVTITCERDSAAHKYAVDNDIPFRIIGEPVAVEKITLSDTSKSMEKGGSTVLTSTVAPTDATNKAVTWSSGNTSVATVDSTGKVTAVSAGTAKIICTAADGTGVTASCEVTVTNPASTTVSSTDKDKVGGADNKIVSVKSVKLNKTTATVKKGKTVTLKATVSPSNATDKAVTWKSSNTKVATVSSSGKVTTKKVGTATITCTTKDGKKKASCKITVTTPVTKVKLNKNKVTLKKGKSVKLKATVTPTKAYKKVTWKSSNTKVATVSSSGKVTAKKKGTATITCTAADGSGKKVTCKITVK